MTPFNELQAVAAPLPLDNIDTDKILPARYLKTLTRSGLGKALFAPMRYGPDGREDPAFVLNRETYRDAKILVAKENFGCGSSREHAPWALLDFGIRCVVACSFADIFQSNCDKNGILCVQLAPDDIETLLATVSESPQATLQISLPDQSIRRSDGVLVHFEIDPTRKRKLLEGADEIAVSLTLQDHITLYEDQRRTKTPWLKDIVLDINT